MTIATEIATITSYDTVSDIPNAVTEATSFCLLHDTDHDEVIKSAALWLLNRMVLERQSIGDPTVIVPDISLLHDLIESLIPDRKSVV